MDHNPIPNKKLKYGVPSVLADGTRNPEYSKRARQNPELKAKQLLYIYAWKKRNRDKMSAYYKTAAAKPGFREKEVSRQKAIHARWRVECPDRLQRRYRRSSLKKYNLSPSQYEEMLLKQDFKCAICDRKHIDAPRKRLTVDHCHRTNKNRKLLCIQCNSVLGHCNDNIEILKKAVIYLESHIY